MNTIKRILAILLVAVMALSLTACSDTKWILKADDEVLNSGIYIYYQNAGYTAAGYELMAEDINYYYYMMYGMSYLDATIGEQTVEEYANEYALDMCKQHVVIERLFDELGLELTAEDKELLKAQLNSAWTQNGEGYLAAGVSKESLEKVILNSLKEEKIFNTYYEVGGTNGTTEEDIKGYLEDNYARVKYMTFVYAQNTEDAVDEAVKAEMLQKANDYLARAKSGESMNDLISEWNELGKKEEATEETTEEVEAETETSEEAETEEETDEYANEVFVNVESTSPSEKFVQYVFENCKVGEFAVIQDDTSFYLVEKLDVLERTDIYEENRTTFLTALFNDEFTSLINDKLEGINIEVNEASIKRYKLATALGYDE